MLNGTVSAFSADRGLGTVTADDGRDYLFHIVEIADGTRSIALGQSVVFRPLRRFGTVEAGELHKV